MKNLLKSISVIMITILILGVSNDVFAKDKDAEYFKEYINIVENMNKAMTKAPKTGNIDVDYLYEMIAHHEGAVDMSKNYLKYNRWTKEIKEIAENIIAKQGENNKHMEEMIKKLQEISNNDTSKENNYLKEYEEAVEKMNSNLENLESTGKMDRDYLEALMIHHQGALDMFDIIEKYTNNVDILKMVEEEKKEQREEMTKIDMILRKTKEFKTHDLK